MSVVHLGGSVEYVCPVCSHFPNDDSNASISVAFLTRPANLASSIFLRGLFDGDSLLR